jgi:hypothetical protein
VKFKPNWVLKVLVPLEMLKELDDVPTKIVVAPELPDEPELPLAPELPDVPFCPDEPELPDEPD